MKPAYKIRNPTTRKVRNRGFEPVTWHNADRIVSGWIYKTGRKWFYFFSPSTGRKRLPLSERSHMRAI
jgi:hypothetical protein